jgi:hypothetical protein
MTFLYYRKCSLVISESGTGPDVFCFLKDYHPSMPICQILGAYKWKSSRWGTSRLEVLSLPGDRNPRYLADWQVESQANEENEEENDQEGQHKVA